MESATVKRRVGDGRISCLFEMLELGAAADYMVVGGGYAVAVGRTMHVGSQLWTKLAAWFYIRR